MKVGYPALLWPQTKSGDAATTPPEAECQRGTVARVTQKEIAVRFARDYDRVLENAVLNLEREDSEVTYQR